MRSAAAMLDPSPTGQHHSGRGHVHWFLWRPLGAVSYLDWGPCSPKLPNSCPETSPAAPPSGSGPSVLPSGAPGREIRPVPLYPAGAAFTAPALRQPKHKPGALMFCPWVPKRCKPAPTRGAVPQDSTCITQCSWWQRSGGLLPEFQSTSGATACWRPLRAGSYPWVLPLISAYSMVCSCNDNST